MVDKVDKKVDLNFLNRMYLSFSVTLKSNSNNFNNKKLSSKMYNPEIKKLSTTLKDSNFNDMFLKSVKKQDVEIVTKFRNLIQLIDKRLELVNKKIKEIEDGEIKDKGVAASQEKVDVLRRILEDRVKQLDDMEFTVISNTPRGEKNVKILDDFKIITRKTNEVIERLIKEIKEEETIYNIIKDRLDDSKGEQEGDMVESISTMLIGDNQPLSFFKGNTGAEGKENSKEIAKRLIELYNSTKKLLDTPNKTIIPKPVNDLIKQIQSIVAYIDKSAGSKLLNSNLKKRLDKFFSIIEELKKEIEKPSGGSIRVRFGDIKRKLTDEDSRDGKKPNKKQLVQLFSTLHPFLLQLLKSENSESEKIDNDYDKPVRRNAINVKKESIEIKEFVRSQIENVIGIYSKDNLLELREVINDNIIKSPLVEDSEFRYSNIERLDLCARELSESLSGTVFSVPLFLPLNNTTLDQLVGKSLTPDERVALIISNMASLNMIVKDRKVFRQAVKKITDIQTNNSKNKNELLRELLRGYISRYAADNIRYVIGTLLNKKTRLIEGDAYKVTSVSLPSLKDIQSGTNEINIDKFTEVTGTSSDFKCEEKIDANVMDMEVDITLYSDKLTSKEIKTLKCNTHRRRLKVYTDYLFDESKYEGIGPDNIIDKLESFVNN